MNTRTKQFLLITSAQTVCLAVGLWMHYTFAAATVAGAVEAQAWSDIQVHLDAAFSELRRTWFAENNATGDNLAAAVEVAASHHAFRPDEVMIVNPDWQVVFPRLRPSDLRPNWTPAADAQQDSASSIRGRLSLDDGVHIAVARPLPGGRGFVVVHHPLALLEARSAALVSSLPAIGGLTLLWTCALLSCAGFVVLARLHDDIDKERSEKTRHALRQTENLLRTRDAVIFGLAKLAEYRDPDTGEHLERISAYSTVLAAELRRHPKFRDEVTPAFVQLIRISSALHDIGKVGIDDCILRKRERLTPEEYTSMQVHTTIGGECLQEIERRLQGSNFLQMAREIAFAHHERWNGEGYPKGLAKTAIPLSARVVAIADIYDALSSRRVYKQAYPHEQCVAMIRDEAGKKLDPELVEVWFQIEQKFEALAEQYAESGKPNVECDSAEKAGAGITPTDADELWASLASTPAERG